MSIPWFEIFVFPGFLFILGLTLLFEHISYRLYSRFDYRNKKSPLFIPLIDHINTIISGEKDENNSRAFLQAIIIILMASIGFTGALIIPISIFGPLPNSANNYKGGGGNTEGIVGVISFEGDIILLLAIFTLFGIMIFFVYFMGNKHTNYESLKKALTFMIFDMPLVFAFAGPIIAEKSLSLSMLVEDIKIINYLNRSFGIFILIPIGLIIAIFALTFKFDQKFIDRFDSSGFPTDNLPFTKNWKYVLWNLSMRTMEFIITATIVSVFLGGPYEPIPTLENTELLAHLLNCIFKCSMIFLATTLIKLLIPRLKSTQATNISLKILTPISLVSILLISGYVIIFGLQ